MVVATANFLKEALGVGIEEGVVSHEEGVEDDSKAPEVCRPARIASRLQHLRADVGRAAVTLRELARVVKKLRVFQVLQLKNSPVEGGRGERVKGMPGVTVRNGCNEVARISDHGKFKAADGVSQLRSISHPRLGN